jgi:ornithine carbamoyltransferase
MEHFLTITETPAARIVHILDVAHRLKQQLKTTGRNDHILANKTLAMIFEKPSLRTRVSFAVGMTQLGGNGLLLRPDEVGLGTREPVQDVARVLGRMCDGIMARTFEHQKVIDLAKWAGVPVINGLTDYSHPCQAMADVMTLQEHFGRDLRGKTFAYIGDGNNVARSLAMICGKLGMRFVIASPTGYRLPKEDFEKTAATNPGMQLIAADEPTQAVSEADIVCTDTWVSMGQETEKAQRAKDFAGYCVDEDLMAHAPRDAVVLHCLPAYRGYEISEGVIESKQSLVFPEAENRLHAQKGILSVLMGGM